MSFERTFPPKFRFFAPKAKVFESFDRAANKARLELFTFVPNHKRDRAQGTVVLRFDEKISMIRKKLRKLYIIPIAPLLKYTFDRMWEENFTIWYDSRRSARVHNTVASFVERALRSFGEEQDLMDPTIDPATGKRRI